MARLRSCPNGNVKHAHRNEHAKLPYWNSGIEFRTTPVNTAYCTRPISFIWRRDARAIFGGSQHLSSKERLWGLHYTYFESVALM